MNRERLTQIRDALLANKPVINVNKEPVGFNMGTVMSPNYEDNTGHNCGTSGCIAGWANVFEAMERNDPYPSSFRGVIRAKDWLGLGCVQGEELFYAWNSIKPLECITPQEAANTITYLLDHGVVDWQEANK